jgi:eukaryotic-like serine/threonine-protein kinase
VTRPSDSDTGAGLASTLAVSPEGGRTSGPPPVALERGASIAHFLVLDTIGAGGMGVVVGAYDPRLDRRVAIKLLRPGAWPGASASEGSQRLLREAKAMARLTHPNVVTVYEVGRFDDGVFLAMEYVDGDTLSAWRAGARSIEEIIAAYADAGRGLDAAHRAGMIHRDFKPDNVMVTRDGRVMVGDFGLASTGALEVEATAGESGSLEHSLTRTGAVVGTPRYMAPEQHTGGEISAKVDQFAFCVALYRAVHGQWPFEGDDLATYRQNVVDGNLREGRAERVPGWLDAVLRRGLDPDPARRFASMDELVAALTRTRIRTWRLAAAAALVVALAGGGLAVGVRANHAGPAPCASVTGTAAPAWDRDAVAAAFAAAERPYLAESARRTLASLDDYAAAVAAMRLDSCRATHVRHEQSTALLDRRTACLDRRAGELAALAGALATADAETLDRAADAAAELTPVTTCGDRVALLAAIAPPEAAIAPRVDELRRTLDRAEALHRTGRYAEGLDAILPVTEEATALGYAPLLAEALHLRARLEQKAGRRTEEVAATFEAAALAAAEAGDDRLLAETWIALAKLVGYRMSLQAEGRRLATVAATTARRAGPSGRLDADLAEMHAALDYEAGRYADARARFERAYELRRELFGAADPRTVSTLHAVATANRDAGDYERALTLEKQVLQQQIELRGPDHPAVGDALSSIGISLDALGRTTEALEVFERSLALREKALGSEHPAVAGSLNSIAIVLSNRGRYDEALAYHQRALAHRQRLHPEGHPVIAVSINNIGTVLEGLKRYEEALEHHRRALELRRTVYGDDHPDVAGSHNNLGVVLKRLQRYGEAFQHYSEALHIRERALGDRHPKVGESLNNLAILAHERQRYKEARELYLRALAIFDGTIGPDTRRTLVTRLFYGRLLFESGAASEAADVLDSALTASSSSTDAEVVHELEMALARALWDAGRDRKRARALAAGVHGRLSEAGEAEAAAEVAAWLRAHGGAPKSAK